MSELRIKLPVSLHSEKRKDLEIWIEQVKNLLVDSEALQVSPFYFFYNRYNIILYTIDDLEEVGLLVSKYKRIVDKEKEKEPKTCSHGKLWSAYCDYC